MVECILLRSMIRSDLLKAEHIGKGMMEPMVLSIDGESEEVSGESTGGNGGAEEAMMVELNFISHPISGIKVKSNCRYI